MTLRCHIRRAWETGSGRGLMQTKPSQADRIVLRHETKAAAAAAAAAGGEDSVGGTDSDSDA